MSSLWTTQSLACVAALILFVWFLLRLHQMRSLVRKAHQVNGVPIMPHSYIFGHILVVAKLIAKRKLPSDLHGHWMLALLRDEYPEVASCGVLYFDVWPLNYPMAAVLDVDMANQILTSPSLPKFWYMRDVEFYHFSGGLDLVTSEGQLWKEERTKYNSGFSNRNIMAMTPWIAEEVSVFRHRLLDAADSGNTIKLEQYTTDLTFDVIARAVFNKRMQAQSQAAPSWLGDLRRQIGLLYFILEPKKVLDPTRRLRHWLYNQRIARALEPLVNEASRVSVDTPMEGPKTVLHLMAKFSSNPGKELSASAMDRAIKSIKMFLFAGHETTSSAIAMTYYLLSQHPEQLQALRTEHDEVFGPDSSLALEQMVTDSSILNRLPYTKAMIKEDLRMSPPVGGSIRQSPNPDFQLVNPRTGVRFPTYGLILHSAAASFGSDPKYWDQPETFMPERFLSAERGEPSDTKSEKNAWQPFSVGPRACIGQELVYLEMKVALALTVRDLDIIPDYPANCQKYLGYAAYQVTDPESIPSARIKDRLPVKIRRRT